MPAPVRCVWGVALMSLCGCVEPEPEVPIDYDAPWIAPESWALVAPAEDPVEGRPQGAPACPPEAMQLEFDAPELDTGACGWITIAAPALYSVPAQTRIQIAFVHDTLISPEPAHSTLLVQTEHALLTTRTVRLPYPAAVVDTVVTAPEGIRAGERVFVHVHNHGANSYRLLNLQPQAPE